VTILPVAPLERFDRERDACPSHRRVHL